MLDKVLFYLCICSSALLWLLTFGYMSVLSVLAFLRTHSSETALNFPEIAVVIPTLNEESSIVEKIKDIELGDYPKDRMNVIVVDGGSEDRTVDFVKLEISRGRRVKLICMNECRSKVDQVNHALRNLVEEIIVFTDADSQLEPSCVKQLVQALANDPETALLGATVKPRSKLLEECIHWMILNAFWWLEGEIFSCAGISGVCYALNRKMFLSIAQDAVAEDIHLGLDVSARGYRVRINRRAVAYELRVPQTPREFLKFRRRRGASYMNELVHSPDHRDPPWGWRIARFVRLLQFTWISPLGLVTVTAALLLLLTQYWPCLFLLILIFALSAVLQVYSLSEHLVERPGFMKLCIATCRYSVLALVSLMSLKKIPSKLGPLGGKKEKYDESPAA